MKINLASIDKIRAIAVVLICLFHFYFLVFPEVQFMQLNGVKKDILDIFAKVVYVFFIFSGFIIPLSLSNSSFELKNIGKFYLKRVLRIMPPFLISIFIFVGYHIFCKQMFGWDFHFDLNQFTSNIFMIAPLLGEEWYNTIYWTLLIEMQFYLLAPFLFLLIVKSNKYVSLVLLLSSNFLAPYFSEISIFHFSSFFILGILVFLFHCGKISRVEFLISTGINFIFIHQFGNSFDIPIICLITLLVLFFDQTKSNFLVFLGQFTYTSYLFHGFLGGNFYLLLNKYFDFKFGNILLIVSMLIFSLTISYLLYLLQEKPFLRLSKKITFKK